MTRAQISIHERIKSLLDWQGPKALVPICDRLIHRQGERLDKKGFPRIEVRVEAARVRPTSFIKSTTLKLSAPALTQTVGGMLDNPVPGLLAMAFHIAHRQLRGRIRKEPDATRRIFISPFLGERTKLGKE